MTDDTEHPDPFPTGFGAPTPSPFPPLEHELQPDPPSDWIDTADAHDLPTRENRLTALGRFAFPPAPPLDDEGVAARDRRWTSRAVVTAAVFLLIFNARSVQNWSRQRAPGWTTSTIQQLADVWDAQLSQLAADQPVKGVSEAYHGIRDARFPGQAPASDAAPRP